MATWIALFRGINVGGKNVIKMAELRQSLEALKLKNVRTYIQSGNVVFESGVKSSVSLGKKISKQVQQEFGLTPQLLIISAGQLSNAIDSNPFAKAVLDPKLMHFFFLGEPAKKPDLDGINAVQNSTEKFKLTDEVFYLHAPDGFRSSKLAPKVEKLLGVAATARNFRTVEKLMAIANE